MPINNRRKNRPGKIFSSSPNEHEADKSLLAALAVLLLFGLVMLFSASSVVSYTRFGNTYHYFLRQFFSLIVSLGLFWFASKMNYHWWKKFAGLFLVFSIGLLLLVFIPGLRSEYGSARSWINIFGFSLQPSELVKISFLIYLAAWLEVKRHALKSWSGGVLPFLIVLGIISALMIAQPDIGTLSIIAVSAVAVFFVAGGRISHILGGVVVAVMILSIIISSGSSSYESDRFKCLKDPSYSPNDKCYQINQSLIAVGSGGLFGRGIGQSRQKFLYLPEVWADAIFPIIAEETGFIFSTLLILLYLFVFYRGLLIARAAPDLFGGALAVGIVVWLAAQTFLNIGGMINLIPMTGVPLPFVSSGGSATLAALLAMGILVNISKHTKGKMSRN
jgi:cell division protein FtsW